MKGQHTEAQLLVLLKEVVDRFEPTNGSLLEIMTETTFSIHLMTRE